MPKKPCAVPGCGRLLAIGKTHCARHETVERAERDKVFDGKRRKDRPSRRWYHTARWKRRRERCLARDPLCKMCKQGFERPSEIADHIIPHRDDFAAFFYGALQGLCKRCHDSKKQRQERRADKLSGGRKSLGRTG